MSSIGRNNAAAFGMAMILATFPLLSFSAQSTHTRTRHADAQTQPTRTKADDPKSFDHAKTGFILRDVHTTLKCEQCHVDGIFKNTPRECAGCHAIGTRVAATPKPVNHVQTTLPCDTCHVSQTSFLVKSFKHVGVTNNCNTCHNHQSLGVKSKPANHFPTLQPCENCHTNTTTFTSWKMDHTGITSGCASCHQGQFAGVVSIPAMHIPTSGQDCSTCHAGTVTFLGAVYSHAGVIANSCNTCHNGSYPGVKSQPATHIPTPAGTFCDTCHTQSSTNNYTSFLGASFHASYSATAGSCSTCHSGAYISWNAQGKPATHIPTTASCDTCHTSGSYTAFSGAGFHTIAVNNGPISAGPCSTCHNGSYTAWTSSNGLYPQAKTATHILTAADCYTCHTSTNTGSYTTFVGAGYHPGGAVNPPSCGSGGCHDTVGGTNANGAQGHPNDSIHTGVGQNCDLCHTQSITLNYTTFLGASYNHNTPPGVCSTCHNGSTATGKPATHIPTAAPCEQCHALPPPSGTATSFMGATFHTIAANNAAAAGICQTCHNGAYTTYASGNGLTPQAQSVPHIPATGSCDACHTSSNTAGYTTFLGANYTHAGVVAGSCSNCHNGSYLGVSYQSYCYNASGCPTVGTYAHSATSGQPCDSCHTAGASANYTTWANAIGGHTHTTSDNGICQTCHNGATAQGPSAGHIPTGSLSCDGCHAKPTPLGSATSFYPGTMNHTLTSASRCDSCHNGSYTTQGVQMGGAQAKVSNHIPTTITAGLDCNTCHVVSVGSIVSSSWGQPPEKMNHNGAQGGGSPVYCVTCHLSGVSYLGSMQKKSHNGASTAKDCSSSSCHKPLGKQGTAYSSW
jgi:hypothetical protein